MLKANRRRSMSATRQTLDSTVNAFVGRIGASLRISPRKRAKEKQNYGKEEDQWLRSGTHYTKIGVERRRSTCSAIFLAANENGSGGAADIVEEEALEQDELGAANSARRKLQFADESGEECRRQRYSRRSNSIATARDRRLCASKSQTDFYDDDEQEEEEDDDDGDDDAEGELEVENDGAVDPRFIDDDEEEEEDAVAGEKRARRRTAMRSNSGDCGAAAAARVLTTRQSRRKILASQPANLVADSRSDDDEADSELLSLALVPLQGGGGKSRSAVSSPMTFGTGALCSTGAAQHCSAAMTRSCPSTPQMARRRYLKEGATQLTSLSTLCTHHRYLFLFNDLLLVTKQKGENSYKLKEKVCLERLWISSNNCTHSFLIGWPIANNYVAHFSSENEKNEWFGRLSDCIRRRLATNGTASFTAPKKTTVSVSVRIEGRQQVIRHEVENGVRAAQIVQQLTETLDLPALDPHLFHYELCFESGGTAHSQSQQKLQQQQQQQPSGGSGDAQAAGRLSASSSATNLNLLSNGGGHQHHPLHQTSQNFLSAAFSQQSVHPLNGVENVYAILMDYVANTVGVTLSDSQLAHLDTCPLVNCRLALRQTTNNGSSAAAAAAAHLRGVGAANAALNIVNQFRRVLSRTDSAAAKQRLFGRPLAGSMPPQPVLTMIDHLAIHGASVEGVFRKSPKQSTVRVLKAKLDHGEVPDFHQFNVHVTASLLKEYLRSIPGQLLISANYHLWMEVADETSSGERKRRLCRNLLRLLPPSHTVLLRSVLRLLRRVAAAETTSKMGVSSLAVCLAPSLLDNPNVVDSARRVPELGSYLIRHADELFDGFVDDALLPAPPASSNASLEASGADGSAEADRHQLHQSTDSGLSDELATKVALLAPLLTVAATTSSSLSSVVSAANRTASISPDSALFDVPMSEFSAPTTDDDGVESSASTTSSSKIRIEEIECTENDGGGGETLTNYQRRRPSAGRLHAGSAAADLEPSVDNAAEEDDRTPVLSRENSDAKSSPFANRYQWRSHLSPQIGGGVGASVSRYVEPPSPDLSAAGGNVRVLRLKPSAAALRDGSASPNLSIASSSAVSSDGWRLTSRNQAPLAKPTPPVGGGRCGRNFVSNLDDLRVSDFIISGWPPKVEDLYAPLNAWRLEGAAPPSRKTSTASVESASRRPLVSKSETLENAGVRSQQQRPSPFTPNRASGTPERAVLARRKAVGSAASENMDAYGGKPPQDYSILTTVSRSKHQTPSSEYGSDEGSASSAAASITSDTVAKRQLTQRLVTPPRVTATTMVKRSTSRSKRVTVNGNFASGGSSAAKATVDECNRAAVARRSSATAAWTSSSAAAAADIGARLAALQHPVTRTPSATRRRSSEAAASSPSNAEARRRPWRPPKRTAEEIILDKSLQVNWSVSSIRDVFQRHADVKPTAIDTVYAKFDAASTKAK